MMLGRVVLLKVYPVPMLLVHHVMSSLLCFPVCQTTLGLAKLRGLIMEFFIPP